MIRGLSFLALVFTLGTVFAEGTSAAINFAALAAQEASKSATEGQIAATQKASESVALTSLSEPQRKAEVASFAESLIWLRDFYRQTWEWHLFSTQVLMVIVLVILGFGLYITYVQFKREYVDRATSIPHTGGDPPSGSLKIGPGGLEITSQVIGLFVLAFSLGFFYLYVKEVYPMQEVALQQKAGQQPSAAK